MRLLPGEDGFGTEGHTTTRCLLAFLAREVPLHPGAPVLDYGAGCGVLGLAAHALGARPVTGVENQRDVLDVARRNARLNSVPWGDEFQVLDPSAFSPGEGAALAVANMLAGPLISVALDVAAATRPGARVGLTGFRRRQAESVRLAYGPFVEFDPDTPVPCEEAPQGETDPEAWVAFFGTRNATEVSTASRSDEAVS